MSLSITVLLLALFPPADQPPDYAKAKLLMEPADVAATLKVDVADPAKKRPVVLDARPKKDYETGHVPDARWVDAEQWAKTFYASQEAGKWTTLIGDLGLHPTSLIVIYDNSKSKDAARIWWILRYWGFEDVRLLNGGWKGWEAGKHPISTAKQALPAKPKGLDLKASKDLHANKEKVLSSLKSKIVQIVDARSEAEYCGDDKKAKKGGAIPGAMHLEWSDALDAKTHRFKSATEISKLLKDKGIDLNAPIITHCQSGGRAAVMAFTLELMGAKNVSNYYNGWSEWGNDPNTPIVTPKKK